MKQICIECDGTIKNTGKQGKLKPMGYMRAGYFVALVANDGTRNSLDLSAQDLDAELLGKLSHVDPSKRWYKVDDINNVAGEQAENTFWTSETNARSSVMDGIRNMNFDMLNINHDYFRQVASMCVEFGFVPVDKCGNMLGEVNEDETEFYPREANERSYTARYVNETPSTPAWIHIDFDFDEDTSDASQTMLSVDSFTAVNPLKAKSMLDVEFGITVDSATELTVKANLIFGTIGNRIPVIGLGTEMANFDIVDSVTGVSVGSPTGIATTGLDDVYTFTIPTVVTSTVYRFEYFKAATVATENGREGLPVTFIAQ
jgi:hypothetical protein